MSSARDLSIASDSVALVTTSITRVNAFAASLVPSVAALAVDGDLLASAILVPSTAARAEAALLSASVELGVTIIRSEALAVITASVVITYEAADAAISAAVPVIVTAAVGAGNGVVDVTLAASTVALVLPVVVAAVPESVHSGVLGSLLADLDRSVVQALNDAQREPGGLATLFTSRFLDDLGRHWDENFSLTELSPQLVTLIEQTLGDAQALGVYPVLLGVVIADGHRVGWFDDGSATLVTGAVSAADAERRARDAIADSQAEIGDQLRFDQQLRILPTDVASLFAGANQIDRIGDDDAADIRIVRNVGADGVVRYIVQIPSTQSWAGEAGPAPNDLTSDLYAMRYGNTTALSHAVLDAMERAGITDEPVMLSGFSLGGITAAAIAADPRGYNVQHVVTAGAPVGSMAVPPGTRVTSFEATEDPIAALDGRANPRSARWVTVREPAAQLRTETGPVGLADAHDANRYALMAKNTPLVNHDPALRPFFAGAGTSTTVIDYQAQRDRS